MNKEKMNKIKAGAKLAALFDKIEVPDKCSSREYASMLYRNAVLTHRLYPTIPISLPEGEDNSSRMFTQEFEEKLYLVSDTIQEYYKDIVIRNTLFNKIIDTVFLPGSIIGAILLWVFPTVYTLLYILLGIICSAAAKVCFPPSLHMLETELIARRWFLYIIPSMCIILGILVYGIFRLDWFNIL